MYAVAMKYMLENGDTEMKAFHVDAKTRQEALGVAFGRLAKHPDVNAVIDWDVDTNHDAILDVIAPHVRDNKKIAAIKAVRSAEFMSLPEAKEYVEKYWEEAKTYGV